MSAPSFKTNIQNTQSNKSNSRYSRHPNHQLKKHIVFYLFLKSRKNPSLGKWRVKWETYNQIELLGQTDLTSRS